jgi:hypothetical protein
MARWRQAVELAMTDEDIEKLAAIARSRSEAARRVERAQILLAYREKPSFFAVGPLPSRRVIRERSLKRRISRCIKCCGGPARRRRLGPKNTCAQLCRS